MIVLFLGTLTNILIPFLYGYSVDLVNKKELGFAGELHPKIREYFELPEKPVCIGMISISMTFAGLTSAFIVSSKRADWLSDFIIPNDFLISTIFIILSSLFFYLSKNKLKAKKISFSKIFLLVTFASAICFVFFHFPYL